MTKILFVTATLPSFSPPLGRSAGLISELAARHPVSLAYFEQPEGTEADYKVASEICAKIIKLQPIPETQNNEVTEELDKLEPEVVILDEIPQNQISPDFFTNRPEAQLITLRPYSLEINGRQLPFGPGLDTTYFQRQLPINITSKLFLFPIQLDPLSKNDTLVCRRAIRYLTERAWPEVFLRHPDATLRIVVWGESADFPVDSPQGEGWRLEYGTIQLREYEAVRLALAPYRDNAPLSVQPWLECWAMQVPLITLPAAAQRLEKLGAKLGDHFLKGEDGPSLAALMSRLLEIRRPGLHLAEAGRNLIEERFSWQAWTIRLESLFSTTKN